MKTNRWIFCLGMSLGLCVALTPSAFAARPSLLLVENTEYFVAGAAEYDAQPDDAHQDQLYSDATKAINEGRWSDAEPLLNQVASAHGKRSDAAVYWTAYVKNKEGRSSEALEACAALRQKYPQSSWLKECSALEIEIRGKNGRPVQPQSEQDEELKLLALNSMMDSGNANALPILKQIIEGQQSQRLKERALFVLAQNQSSQAQDLLGQIVRGEKDPALQIKAINLLAAAQGEKSAQLFSDIYAKSNDASVKRAVLNAYLIMGDSERVAQVALHESDPELARHAINELGAMGDVSRLAEIYKSNANKDVKSAILNAYVAAGSKGSDALASIASSEQDPELRRRAIRNMGTSGGAAAAPALVAMYSKAGDEGSKKAVLDALFVANDAHDLVALARNERDIEAKKNIVGKLAVMHDKEATDYLMELLNK